MTLKREYIVPFLKTTVMAVVVSFYLFPVGFVGLPESLNTKQMLAVMGAAIFVLRCAERRALNFDFSIFMSFIIAVAFSVWCYFCCVAGNTADYAYATYFLSFLVWTGAAYAVCTILSAGHGELNLEILTRYIALVCVVQCGIVLLVDHYPGVMNFVDSHFIQDITPKKVHRLYGIGCSLDSGGVRMCMAEILIAHQLVHRPSGARIRFQAMYIVALIIIAVIGNMIARTTTVGLLLALIYLLLNDERLKRHLISSSGIRKFVLSFFLILIGVSVCVYLYRTNPSGHKDIRFAFEGFFNLFEKGEFTTGSTETLNSRMWVWPWDSRGWLMGYGLFEWSHWYASGIQTDIGYCRFTLYCGLIGLTIFSLYFIYNARVVSRRFRNADFLAFFLIALTFIIWIKVSTDIFQLYALLFCLPHEGRSTMLK